MIEDLPIEIMEWLGDSLKSQKKRKAGSFAISLSRSNAESLKPFQCRFGNNYVLSILLQRIFKGRVDFKDQDNIFLIWPTIPGTKLDLKTRSIEELIKLCKDRIVASFIHIDIRNSKISWFQSEWSSCRFFFRIINNELYLGSEAGAFKASKKEISKDFIKFFLEFGWCPPELSPVRGTQVAQEEVLYSYDQKNGVRQTPLPKNRSSEKVKDSQPEAIYQLIRDYYLNFLEINQIKFLPLTGGADTRLLLSMLPNPKDFKFFFKGNGTGRKAENDKRIVREIFLTKKLNGVIINNFTSYDNNEYFGDFLPKKDLEEFQHRLVHINGHGGGELLGGFLETMEGHKSLVDKDYITPKLNWKRVYDTCLEDSYSHIFGKHGGFGNTKLFYKSFLFTALSDFYNDELWETPIKLFYQSNSWSPFLHPDLLDMLSSPGFERRCDYKFYRKLYQSKASHMMDFPFQSPIVDKIKFLPIAEKWEDPVRDPENITINTGVIGEDYLPINPTNKHIKRINLLNKYFKDFIEA
jgi:hypothetical protein